MEFVKSFKQTKIIKYLFIALLGSILLAISSKIKIPFYPVPMTMQTFVVIFLGMSLGYKLGLATVTLYLIEGILGIPVFSNSPEKGIGIIYFTGPTMGYLLGFMIAVYAAGKLNFNTPHIINNLNADYDHFYPSPIDGNLDITDFWFTSYDIISIYK